MTVNFDNYLINAASEYYKDCEPEIIHIDYEYEGKDEYGNVETSESYTYSCQECDDKSCEHWLEYNEQTDEEEDEE